MQFHAKMDATYHNTLPELHEHNPCCESREVHLKPQNDQTGYQIDFNLQSMQTVCTCVSVFFNVLR